MPSIIVAAALSDGVSPKRIPFRIRSGQVSLPAPAVKFEITTSSNENVNDSIAPATIAGASRGSVTWRNVASADAPRSMLASSSVEPIDTKRARTTSSTSDALNTEWARNIVTSPSSKPTFTKKISDDTAITSSGTTSVRKTSTSNGLRMRRLTFESASAAAVPKTVATTADATAISNERVIADVIVSSSSARLNGCVEKPAKSATLLPELNAKITTTTIGKKRNAYTSALNPPSSDGTGSSRGT